MQDTILTALNWRYAVKEFDQNKPLNKALVDTILESGRLAPSSDGFEPWKFIVVHDPATRQKLRDVAYGQPKVTDAPYLVVLAYRTDADALADEQVARIARVQNQSEAELAGLKQYFAASIAAKKAAGFEAWSRAQSYIPLGIMIETAALLNVDAGPMEGFDPQKVGDILGLPAKNLKATTMLALGYRAAEPKRPKVRRSPEEVIEFVGKA